MDATPARLLAASLVRAVRAAGTRIPEPVRKRIEDRVFHAIFHLTRVTNDHYPDRRGRRCGDAGRRA